MKDLNAQSSSYNSREQSSFLFGISNIKNKLQKLYKRMTDYTDMNKKEIDKLVAEVNSYKSKMKKADNISFILKTDEFKERLRNGESIDDIMCEALAVAREATYRKLGLFPYDVQIEAAIAMIGKVFKSKDSLGNKKDAYQRVIAEMKTGEGKTLVQILVAYLDLLEATKDEDKSKWRSVHIMTSNDALAKRDADANRAVFELLGFSCGYVPSRRGFGSASEQERINHKMRNYACDVVYATPSAIAFDYLHDNIVFNINSKYLKKPYGFAIIDEADDILIDQATNPLKLSAKFEGFDEDYEKLLSDDDIKRRKLYDTVTALLYGRSDIGEGLTYKVFDQFYKNRKEIFEVDYSFVFETKREKFEEDYVYCKDTRDVYLSSKVEKKLEKLFPDKDEYYEAYFALMNAIKARHGYTKNKEYNIVEEFNIDTNKYEYKIIPVDQNSGRRKMSNRYVGGMQEAIEAKEEYFEQQDPKGKKRYHITYSAEVPIRAMFTYPDFLSIYENRVSGMTGTSDEDEMHNLYGFNTYRVGTRKENIRIDEEDELYATKKAKYKAILKEVKKCTRTHQPVLIGTTSIKESIELSELLKLNNITHNLLNAENEEMESDIIKVAGMYGSVTIATNMAGRGTDIKLGGENATIEDKRQIKKLGGLYVIGTSRNKSSRIDLQLRGRAARQGDPGKTKYFSSLEDDLVKENYKGSVLDFLIEHFDTGEPIKNKKIIRSAKKCQDLRESKDKQGRLDNEKFNIAFMNQRKALYEERNRVLESTVVDIKAIIDRIAVRYSSIVADNYSLDTARCLLGHIVNVDACYSQNKNIFRDNLTKAIKTKFNNTISSIANVDKHTSFVFIKTLQKRLLNIIDVYWIDHINSLDALKSTNIISSIEDPFKDYETAANYKFYNEVIPSMYNEMLTYATHPNMKFGEYMIKQSEDNLLPNKRM